MIESWGNKGVNLVHNILNIQLLYVDFDAFVVLNLEGVLDQELSNYLEQKTTPENFIRKMLFLSQFSNSFIKSMDFPRVVIDLECEHLLEKAWSNSSLDGQRRLIEYL